MSTSPGASPTDSDESISTSPSQTGCERGLQLAYAYLNRRERTTAEVKAHLAKAQLPRDEIEATVGILAEYGYLDDARYARLFTEDKRTLELWGEQRIARALRERGITTTLIDAALNGELETSERAERELKRAIAVLRHRFPASAPQPHDRERAFRALRRKGYCSETASAAIRACLDER